MSKNYALLKPYVWALTLLITTMIIVYSCKKDGESNSLTSMDSQKLKEWYVANVKVSDNDFSKIAPLWIRFISTVRIN
ncbi:hypothetical protein [Pedobacter agri]|uniref:hypothetical protein n=1 Tax=Pedobacter agri TaxID=454586 RepID=UPI00292E74B0|nr:hypothetical protein [Pedobacter agri]